MRQELSSDGLGRSAVSLREASSAQWLGGQYRSWEEYIANEKRIYVKITETQAPKGYEPCTRTFYTDLKYCNLKDNGLFIVKGDADGQAPYMWDPNIKWTSPNVEGVTVYPNDEQHGLRIRKVSSNLACTQGNPNYTLEGAVFGIYKDAACTTELMRVTTDANGESFVEKLPNMTQATETYYIKELSAPKGYQIARDAAGNPEVKSVTVSRNDADQSVSEVTFADPPVTDPANISIQKADAKKTGTLKASMAGAIFTVKYYNDIITDGNPDPAAAGKTVAKKDGTDAVWTFKTDANGRLNLNDPNAKVSGPSLWLNSSHTEVRFPLGTVTIQETTAPNGYLVNKSVLVTQIVEKRNGADTESSADRTYYTVLNGAYKKESLSSVNNIYTLNENSLDLQFHKTDKKNQPLDSTVFKHSYTTAANVAATEVLTTDRNGNILIRGLTQGKHTIEESSPKSGYVKNENKLVFTVNADRTVTFETAGLKDGTLVVHDEAGKNVATTSSTVVVDATKIANATLYAAMSNEEVPPIPNLLHVSKTVLGGTKELPGAELKVVKGESANGEVVEKWTSTTAMKLISLDAGTYTLVEEKAPNGFTVAKPITFRIASGKVEIKQADGRFVAANQNTVRMEDAKIVKISKTVVNGTTELEGAALKVVKGESKDGKDVVASWTSTKQQREIQLSVGTYTLVETATPNGFAFAESITFTVDNDGKIMIRQANGTYADAANNTVRMQDAKVVKISKTAVNGTTELEGAALKVVKGESKDGKDVVASWTSTKTQREIQLGAGTYTLVETSAPNGYEIAESITFKIDAAGKLTIQQTNGTYADAANSTVHMEDAEKPTEVEFSKTVLNGTEELEGAELKVVKGESKDGKDVVASWTSTKQQREIQLGVGTYTLVETTAPNGFAVAESITFKIDETGRLTVKQANGTYADAANSTVHMQDAKVVKISKTAVNGTTELEGAALKVVKGESKDGKDVVASWTSTKTQRELRLGAGTYTLIETQAPNGFAVAESITFTVDNDGKIMIRQANGNYVDAANSTVKMEDAKIVKISKTAINQTEELPGAKLQVVRGESKDGKDVIASWTSTKDQKEIQLGVGTYTLVETTAPFGYEIAESISFKVTEEGKLMVKQADGNYAEAQNVHMQDRYMLYALNILKTNQYGETKALEGAEFTLFRDAACTQVVTRGTTDRTGHLVFGKLEQNTTYYMKETKAPEGYMLPKLQNGDEIVYTLTVDLDSDHGYRYSVTLPKEATGEKPMTIGEKKTITIYSDGSAKSDLMSTTVNAQNELTVSLHVINPTTAKLPATGSSMMLFLMGLGIALMGIAVLTGKKKKSHR